MKKRSVISVLLCILLLISSVCGTTASAEVIYSEGNICTFETFEDLKNLASMEYDYVTKAYYIGVDPLIIDEDLEVPPGLCIDAYGKDIIITEDANVYIESPYSYLDVCNCMLR